MSAAIVVLWIVPAVGAAVIGRLAGSHDVSAPWPTLLAVTLVGAFAGGLVGLALTRDNVSGAFALRSVLARRREGHGV